MSQGDREQTSNSKKNQNTALNTLLGGVSRLADRNKRNRGCTERVEPTWCCHGNHIPQWWWGDQPGEWEQRTGKPTHTNHTTSVCLSLCIFKMKKEKKKKKETSWLNSSNSNVIHLWIGYYFGCQNDHPAICSLFLNPATNGLCVCVCVGKTHNMLQQYGMYCYRLMCNRGNNWMTKSKKYLAMFP